MTEPAAVPHVPAPTQTLVLEAGRGGRQLLWIDGPLVLPVGSRIEFTRAETLDGATADAEVVDVRLIAANAIPTLVLEVMLIEAGASRDRP